MVKGYKHTEETKKKISDASKLHWRQGLNKNIWNRVISTEEHQRRSDAIKLAHREGRMRKVTWFTGIPKSDEHKRKISETRKRMGNLPNPFHKGHQINPKGVHRSPATEFKKGDPRQRHIGLCGRMKQIFPKKHTKIEIMMQDGLHAKNIQFDTNKSVLGICIPDVVIPDKKIAVFCDGDYWHNRPDYKIRDARQNETLQNNGWVVLRFWEHEIHNNVENCVNKVLEVVRQ